MITKKSEPNRLKGEFLSNRMFCSMLHSFIEEANDNCMINLNNAWDYIIENECILAYNEAIAVYRKDLEKYFQSDDISSFFSLAKHLTV